MRKNTKKIAILAIILMSVISFYVMEKQSLSLYFISAYSRLTEGTHVDIGNVKFELRKPWYIKNQSDRAAKIFRLPGQDANLVVGILELKNPEEIGKEINNQYFSKTQLGEYEAYKIEINKRCSGIEAECQHMIFVIPQINLKITISNYLPHQDSVVSEVTDLILEATS